MKLDYVLTEGKVHDFQVEKNFLNGKLKAVTAYFSDTSIQKNISSFQWTHGDSRSQPI